MVTSAQQDNRNILNNIDQKMLLLSKQFGVMVSAFLREDQTEFEQQRSIYFSNLESYLEYVQENLYAFLKHETLCPASIEEFCQFEIEAMDFYNNISRCWSNLQQTEVGKTKVCGESVYSIDNRMINWHMKERDVLYPIYEQSMRR